MLRLTSKGETYEISPNWESDVEPEKRTVFVMRKLQLGEYTQIQDQITATDGTGKGSKLRYLGGTATRLKLQKCIVDWRNVLGENDAPLACSDANKLMLPLQYMQWLEEHVDEVNVVKGPDEEVAKN